MPLMRGMKTPMKNSPVKPAVSMAMYLLKLSNKALDSILASVKAAMMPMMPTTYVQTWPHLICALPEIPGLKRLTKSVTTAVDAEERFADSVDIVAANTAAITSPASHGGISVAMKIGRTESPFGIVTSIASGCVW